MFLKRDHLRSSGTLMRKVVVASVLIILAVLGGVNALAEPALNRFTFSEPHMGTMFNIVLYASNEAAANKAVKEAFARIEQLNRIFSD